MTVVHVLSLFIEIDANMVEIVYTPLRTTETNHEGYIKGYKAVLNDKIYLAGGIFVSCSSSPRAKNRISSNC